MVLLGLRFLLMKSIPKRARDGIYAGKGIMFGHVTTFSGKKWVLSFVAFTLGKIRLQKRKVDLVN